MTILSAQAIEREAPLEPLLPKSQLFGLSAGLSAASYDIRIAEDLELEPGAFKLASTIERFKMPHNVAASVKDKSTLVRRGLSVQNTFIDPGWEGFLTLELKNLHPMPQSPYIVPSWRMLPGTRRRLKFQWALWHEIVRERTIALIKGQPIAQIVFEYLDEHTREPYAGKYQRQQAGPQVARHGSILTGADEEAILRAVARGETI